MPKLHGSTALNLIMQSHYAAVRADRLMTDLLKKFPGAQLIGHEELLLEPLDYADLEKRVMAQPEWLESYEADAKLLAAAVKEANKVYMK